MRYSIRSIFIVIGAFGAGFFSQCANKEVKHQLDRGLQTRGQSYALEMQAQSPFEKVSLSWSEATELMMGRNPNYQKVIASKKEAERANGLIKNFTYEVKKSLTSTASQTLNPQEIVKAINNPVAELPRRLKSLTDLKNISHLLEQKEWSRVGQSVNAEKSARHEMVKLHVLFRQEKVIEEHKEMLEKLEELVVGKASLEKLLKKKRVNYESQRKAWLNSVRDFFNAEYYDVSFEDFNGTFTLYRNVADPKFDQWQRWGSLGHSEELAKQMRLQHKENKPVIPGMNSLKTSLGIKEFQNNLADREDKQTDIRGEVRMMLKKWRELKNTQSKITDLESKNNVVDPEQLSIQTIEESFKVYQFLQTEIHLVSYFWMLDEDCWS